MTSKNKVIDVSSVKQEQPKSESPPSIAIPIMLFVVFVIVISMMWSTL